MSLRSKTCVIFISLCLCLILKEAASSSISDTFTKAKDVFKPEKQMSTFKKVTTWMTVGGHLAKAVFDLVKLIKTFTGDNESKELKYLKEQFNIVNTKMDSLDYEFSEIKELIDWNVVRVNFGEYERRIKATDEILKDYISAPLAIREIYQDIFVNNFISHYGDAATKLFNGLITESQIFGENLFAVARRYYANDRVKVAEFGAYVCRIVQRGLNQEAAFRQLAGYEDSIEDFVKDWEKKFDNLKKFASKIDSEIVSSWNRQYKVDADKFIVRNPNLDTKSMASSLYRLLDNKYPWRAWVIVVFPNRKGDDKVWKVENCGGDKFEKYNVGNKIILINSADAGVTPSTKPASVLSQLSPSYTGRGVSLSATYIFDRIRSSSCNNHFLKAVFEDKTNPIIQGPEVHVSVKKSSITQTRYRYPSITRNYWAVLAR